MIGGGFGGMYGFPWIGVLWVVVLAVGAFALVRLAMGHRPGPHHTGGGTTPEQVLKQRYARGEISREEYERMLDDLRR